ncbi:MAG: GrpB family protein [Ornithinimicrobium sp.]
MSDWPAWATEKVEVCPAHQGWQERGEKERLQLEAALGAWLVAPIEHVGSTSVPNLAAKPILDFQAAVNTFDGVAGIAATLAPTGWHYVPPELDGRTWRRFFVEVSQGHRVAHLHVMLLSNPRWRQQLIFRDALRADSRLVQQYAALKQRLAAQHVADREAYTAGKADFIASVLDGAHGAPPRRQVP